MTTPERREPSLLRAIGTVGLAAGIVNVTIGGGIFRLPAAVAGILGAHAPLAFVVCAVVMGLIVAGFAEAGRRVDLTGGPYAYVEVAFGPFAGFLAGVLVWLLGTTAVAAVSTVFADQIGGLVPVLAGAGGRVALLVLTFGVLAAVNIAGVGLGTRLNAIATAAKLLPLAVLIVAGAFALDPANLAWNEPMAGGSLARGSMLLIFAFCGVESALVPSGEIRDVAKTVPRAVALAMVVVTFVYLALQIVAQGILGPGLQTETAPLAAAAGRAFGPWGARLLLGGAAVSVFGYVSGMTLAVPRALYAFARDGILPKSIGAVHPRFRTPWVAIVLQTALVVSLGITSGFERLAILANLSTLVLYAGCSLAAWRLAARDGGRGARRAAIVSCVACAAIAWLLTSITWPEWRVALLVLGGASLLYVVARRLGRRSAAV
ncbi:MAG TPA: APC family permease [Candidatus Polarisedimenticolia bacterium]|nr:APC family permease [Candidatus Polarisedimenticolia bacterium]